ncbi:MAG: hypothetical protein GF331_23385 [Chitinivibrionales bacterium]|nr:hypothetical protein [Chitinivibrionales bacterium]
MACVTRFAGVCLAVLVFSGIATADSLNVNGTISDDQDSPVEGAVVTVTFGMGGGGTQVVDTTGADGVYDINTVFGGGGGGMGMVQISAAADGYITGTDFAVVQDANDGVADTVTQDFSLVSGQQPAGDSLYVSGTVRDVDQNALEGATVTVTILTMTGTLSAQATTDAQGAYEVAVLNEAASRNAIVEASADGFLSQQVQVQIGNPDDGNPDMITRDFALEAIVYDTLIVVGRALDSATLDPLEGALAVVSYWSGGFGGEEIADSVLSGADGRFSLQMVVATVPAELNWSVELAGYATESGRSPLEGDTVDLGNVQLVAFGTTDSLTYVVRGQITNDLGNAMRGVDVAVLLVFDGTDTLIIDTATTGNRGRYQVESALVPYQTGDITATVVLDVEGYGPVEQTSTVPSSTSEIVMDVQLSPLTVIAAPAGLLAHGVDMHTCVYTIDGRLVATLESGVDKVRMAGLISRMGRQPLILRTMSGSSLQTRMLVPAH